MLTGISRSTRRRVKAMPVTLEQLTSFQRFAEHVVSNGGADSFDELLQRWQAEEEYLEVEAAVKQGLREIDASLGRPANEFLDEFCRRNNIA
jgi:hypothetical protein